MTAEKGKFDEVIDLLRKSKPVLDSTREIEDHVISVISREKRPVEIISELTDFIFGWTYIGWVRRSLAAVSFAILIFFLYQQGVMMKRIDSLSKQMVKSVSGNNSVADDEIEKMLTVYINSGHRFPARSIIIPENKMKELVDSVRELQEKYKVLEKIINDNPDLKEMIQKKLLDKKLSKINM